MKKKWPRWVKYGMIGSIVGLIQYWLKYGSFGFEVALFQPSLLVSYTVIGIFIGLVVGKIKKGKSKKVVVVDLNEPSMSEATIAGFLVNQTGGQNNPSSHRPSFPAVSATELINVHVYKDAEETLADYKTFDFDYVNKTNPLLEKELFQQLDTALQVHGLTRDKKNPQILISMDFFIGKKEQYTPPTTITSTKLMYDWNIVSLGNSWGGMSSTVPITSSQTTPGFTTVTYYSNIRLNFLNYAKLLKGKKLKLPPMIWMGEADSEGSNPEIRGIAPIMFNELVEQFLNPTYLFSERRINRVVCGGLGLGFNTADWSMINRVQAFSVAAEHGIKPGDRVLTINGKLVGNWSGFRYPQGVINASTNYPVLYRSKDPYFQDILANTGDKEVALVIRSGETGKKIKLKLMPRRAEYFVQIDPTVGNITHGNPIANAFGILIALVMFIFFLKFILSATK